MHDCDRCQLYRNGNCAGLSCQGFKPIPYLDPDILKAAQEALDDRNHRGNRYGSRNVEAREEKIKQAQSVRSKNVQKTKSSKASSQRYTSAKRDQKPISKVPDSRPVYTVRIGQQLFYKDKQTGLIRPGTVINVTQEKFLFRYNTQEAWLSFNVIGDRLFFTCWGAQKT